MASFSDSDVPPLEDMTEYLKSTKKKEVQQAKTDSSLLGLECHSSIVSSSLQKDLLIVNKEESAETTTKGSDECSTGSSKCSTGSDGCSTGSDGCSTGSGKCSTGSSKCSTGESGSRSVNKCSDKGIKFGGMKKGFLFGSSKESANKKPVLGPLQKREGLKQDKEDIPFLKVSSKTDSTKRLELDEVQEEMKKSLPFIGTKDWVTEDLLKKLDQNPVLSKAFTDPALSRLLEEFHQNPQAAMAAAQSNPEVREFLQEFCGLMGDHFTAFSNKEKQVDEELLSEQLTQEDMRMKEALTKPEVQQVLTDPDIQHLINLLKDKADEAQRFLESRTSGDFHSKVRLLIDHGVLNIQRR